LKNLGYFEDEKDAAMAYDKALLEAKGLELAKQAGLNFPEEHTDTPGEHGHAMKLPRSQRLPITTQDAVDMAVKSIVAAYQAGHYVTVLLSPPSSLDDCLIHVGRLLCKCDRCSCTPSPLSNGLQIL
jgi:hypothetical protein